MINSLEEKFSNYLNDVIWPTDQQKHNENWNVSGILKKNSNQHLKFDVRPMFSLPKKLLGKKMTTKNKSDKVVFETDNQWILIDTKELNNYILNLNTKEKIKIIYFEELIKKLDWNIYINKK